MATPSNSIVYFSACSDKRGQSNLSISIKRTIISGTRTYQSITALSISQRLPGKSSIFSAIIPHSKYGFFEAVRPEISFNAKVQIELTLSHDNEVILMGNNAGGTAADNGKLLTTPFILRAPLVEFSLE